MRNRSLRNFSVRATVTRKARPGEKKHIVGQFFGTIQLKPGLTYEVIINTKTSNIEAGSDTTAIMIQCDNVSFAEEFGHKEEISVGD